jgi:hypothetical protein
MRYQMLVALAWAVAIAGPAIPQQPQPPAARTEFKFAKVLTQDELDKQLNENIEIMCRLLDRAVRRVTGDTASGYEPLSNMVDKTWQITNGANYIRYSTDEHSGYLLKMPETGYLVQFAGLSPLLASFQKQRIEGSYLKGYGVVFSVTLPITRLTEVVKRAQKPDVQPSNDWERLRRELHGEKAERAEQAPKPEPESLADAIMKVLAENGQHFSNLAENEQLVVAITLRSARDGKLISLSLDNTARLWSAVSRSNHSQDPSWVEGVYQAPKGGKGEIGTALVPPRTSTDSATALADQLPDEARNRLLLGELLMKQHQSKEAAAQFQRALSALQEMEKQTTTAEKEARQYLAELMLLSRLAESRMSDDDEQKAQKALGDLSNYLKKLETKVQALHDKAGQARDEAKASKHTLVRLPAKLILAVTKGNCQNAATGKMSLEDFKKAVSVTYRSWGEE